MASSPSRRRQPHAASEDADLPETGLLSTARNAIRIVLMPAFVGLHVKRQLRVQRSRSETDRLGEQPPSVRPHPRMQRRHDGEGPVVMRSYEVRIADADVPAEELVERFRLDPNRFCSSFIAGFVKGNRKATDLRVGEELVVEIPGPWNGPVVVDSLDDGVLLATLEGHMEAGHIRFRTIPGEDASTYTFEIRSWARAGDSVFGFLHRVVPVGREFQTAMWCAMCDRAVSEAGGIQEGPLRVSTETLAGSSQ